MLVNAIVVNLLERQPDHAQDALTCLKEENPGHPDLGMFDRLCRALPAEPPRPTSHAELRALTNRRSMRRVRKAWMRFLRRVHPEITVRVGNRRMRIDLRDRIIAKSLFRGVEWEPELRRLRRAMDLDEGDDGVSLGQAIVVFGNPYASTVL